MFPVIDPILWGDTISLLAWTHIRDPKGRGSAAPFYVNLSSSWATWSGEYYLLFMNCCWCDSVCFFDRHWVGVGQETSISSPKGKHPNFLVVLRDIASLVPYWPHGKFVPIYISKDSAVRTAKNKYARIRLTDKKERKLGTYGFKGTATLLVNLGLQKTCAGGLRRFRTR